MIVVVPLEQPLKDQYSMDCQLEEVLKPSSIQVDREEVMQLVTQWADLVYTVFMYYGSVASVW